MNNINCISIKTCNLSKNLQYFKEWAYSNKALLTITAVGVLVGSATIASPFFLPFAAPISAILIKSGLGVYGITTIISISFILYSNNTKEVNHVSNLMDSFTSYWCDDKKDFIFPKITQLYFNEYTNLLNEHADKFTKQEINNNDHFGYIQKFDLNSSDNPAIYMRADLHGDLKSLIENLRTLQSEGLLDENYRCKKGVHLVFLGDYCDRGVYGLQILELLMRLREENPNQVHLIRGNHEDLLTNKCYGKNDEKLMTLLSKKKGENALQRFYETMSLTTYFSVDNDNGPREYIQCTHGLFELSMDPAPLLDNKNTGDYLPVPKKRELSERVKNLQNSDNEELKNAADRISELSNNYSPFLPYDDDCTMYNWGDVTQDNSTINSLVARQFKLNASDILSYFKISSPTHKVKMLFRGHQHKFQHLTTDNNIVVATTLPVGMDCPAYNKRWNQDDRAYIIRPKLQVSDWKKRAILREKHRSETRKITKFHTLTSSKV